MSKFYSSNFDKYITPKEKGYYIQYTTESGDKDFIGPFALIEDEEHAIEILKKELTWEWEFGEFYASFEFYDKV